MNILEKRGLSPVIATVLLISIALVLAVIIFLWAKSFVEEQIQKDGQQIELVCENVRFLADASLSEGLLVENVGSIPIYTVEIRVEGEGEIREVPDPPGGQSIGAGQTASFELPNNLELGDNLMVVPVLLGESQEQNDLVPRACDIDYGVQAEVGA